MLHCTHFKSHYCWWLHQWYPLVQDWCLAVCYANFANEKRAQLLVIVWWQNEVFSWKSRATAVHVFGMCHWRPQLKKPSHTLGCIGAKLAKLTGDKDIMSIRHAKHCSVASNYTAGNKKRDEAEVKPHHRDINSFST